MSWMQGVFKDVSVVTLVVNLNKPKAKTEELQLEEEFKHYFADLNVAQFKDLVSLTIELKEQ